MERMTIMTNKKNLHCKALRKEVASLLKEGKEETARIRCEVIIAEENVISAFEILCMK